MTLISNIIVL